MKLDLKVLYNELLQPVIIMTGTAHKEPKERHTMVSTSTTPLELLVMLYDGAIDVLNKAEFHERNKDEKRMLYYISRAMSIVEELINSLNMDGGGQIAHNLQNLYVYILKELTLISAKRDCKGVENIRKILTELRAAWKQIR